MVHGYVLGCRLFLKSCGPLSLEVFWFFHRRCCAACFFVVEPQRHFLAWSHHQICLLLMPQKWRWGLFCVCMEKADNAWHRRGKQKTPTINPNDRQPAHLTDQAPGTIERAAQESRRLTSNNTAAVHASSTATTRHNYLHPTGTSPDPLS